VNFGESPIIESVSVYFYLDTNMHTIPWLEENMLAEVLPCAEYVVGIFNVAHRLRNAISNPLCICTTFLKVTVSIANEIWNTLQF